MIAATMGNAPVWRCREMLVYALFQYLKKSTI